MTEAQKRVAEALIQAQKKKRPSALKGISGEFVTPPSRTASPYNPLPGGIRG